MGKQMMVTPDSPICPDCDGYGSRQNAGQQPACGKCNGLGRLPIEVEVPDRVVCPTCHGEGFLSSDVAATLARGPKKAKKDDDTQA